MCFSDEDVPGVGSSVTKDVGSTVSGVDCKLIHICVGWRRSAATMNGETLSSEGCSLLQVTRDPPSTIRGAVDEGIVVKWCVMCCGWCKSPECPQEGQKEVQMLMPKWWKGWISTLEG